MGRRRVSLETGQGHLERIAVGSVVPALVAGAGPGPGLPLVANRDRASAPEVLNNQRSSKERRERDRRGSYVPRSHDGSLVPYTHAGAYKSTRFRDFLNLYPDPSPVPPWCGEVAL